MEETAVKEPAENSLKKSSMKDLLQIRNYRYLLFGQAIAMLGDGVYTLALVWSMKELTGSSVHMAYVLAAGVIPTIILGIFAGVIVDRGNQKNIMLAADIFRSLALFGLFTLFVLDLLAPWMLIVSAFIVSSFSAFFTPARAVAIRSIVPDELMIRAQSASSTVQVVTGLAAPVIAGILLAIGLRFAFLFNAIMFLLSFVFIRLINQPELLAKKPEKLNRSVFMTDLKEGFHTIIRAPILRAMIIYLVLINFMFAPVELLLPAYVNNPSQLAIIEVAFFIGILTGSIAINFFADRPKIYPIVIGLLMILLPFAGLGVITNFIISCLFIGLAGAGSTLVNITLSTLFMVKIPREVIGRSQSTMRVLLEGVNPASLLLAGILMTFISVQQMFLAIAAFGIIIVLLMVANPLVRKAA
ncbi:MFS transporter [Bacillus sp. FJAT-27916]|uniref:MFS transporter n=1 Tax=Bacillus sp. FJAT-27916 TaxID=1679169 RepID=UPI0006708DD2|nr:MFS transporter [Bacillus sp. FJAT-27916]